MPLARDLLQPSLEEEKKKHKKKQLVQSRKSYFTDVKCPGCYKITSFQPCSDSGSLCGLSNCVVPAHRRKSQAHRRLSI